ncbi:hypothetical protein K469DRAFT_307483 [Zopfia rhizophila CBS 207.26]|uniref:Integral membrane protein n=1 Tax=Zopfia rhizophila CBS 207.26 TaxID=1314779 RepID=A0A6A6ENE0_9PEZI|nr:hypothetical protein K469DRAFT_307483 [Zopfia rhizophila CBS 207.26]
MRGIVSIPTHLVGTSFKGHYELGRIVIDIIFFVAIFIAWIRQPAWHRTTKVYRFVLFSAHVVLAWYIFTLLDLFLHESRLKATYGYILFYFFLAAIKLSADVSLLSGVVRITIQQIYHKIRNAKVCLLVSELFIILLMILALYYIGSFLADEVVWLQVVEPVIAAAITNQENKLETAFVVFQWLLSSMALVGSSLHVLILQEEDNEAPLYSYLTVVATSSLFIRSLAELVIVVRYHLHHHLLPKGTPLARDFIYGICTFSALLCLASIEKETPVENTSNPAEPHMEEEIRRRIIKTLDAKAAAKEALPSLSSVIKEVKRDFRGTTGSWRDDLDSSELSQLSVRHGAYLDTVDQKYGYMVPVDTTREVGT